MAININGSTGISGVDGSAGTPALQGSDTNTGISFGTDEVNINTGGTSRVTVDSSGQVGVGTTSPSKNLEIAATSAEAAIALTSSGRTLLLSSHEESGVSQATKIGTTSNHELRIITNNTERMRINANGAITTPTTATSYHSFGVNQGGDIIANFVNAGSSIPYGVVVYFSAASPNDTSRYFLSCSDSTTARAVIRSNGGLANYSANNVNLSDINSKKDITPAAGTWDCLKEWEIVNFRYKDQPDHADLNMGVIAQQVAESCPEVITVFQEAKEATETEPAQEERLGVKDQQMVWMAIKALQEAQIRIETLETEMAAVKAALDAATNTEEVTS